MPPSGAPASVTVLVVDPHASVRGALAAALSAEPGIAVVAAVGTAEEALASARRYRPLVALVDPGVFGDRGLAWLGELHVARTDGCGPFLRPCRQRRPARSSGRTVQAARGARSAFSRAARAAR
jgi:DNA-binding NarL/FixJ family response regulator